MRTTLMFLILGVAAAAAQADPVMVHNPAAPVNGVQTLALQEMWRAGGAADDDSFFGLVAWAEAGDDGLIYVLDGQLCQVNVYDDAGTLVRTLFHEGDGPGEVRRPRDLVLMPGGAVGAVQEFPGKIVLVDRDNTPLPSLEPRRGSAADGGLIALTAAEHRGGTFLVAGVQIRPGERPGTQRRHMYLATSDEHGAVGEPLVETFIDWDFAHFTYDEAANLPPYFWANAVGPDGRVYAAPARDAYRINVYAPDGTLERVIEREYRSLKRRPEDVAWLQRLFDGVFRQLPGPYDVKICENESDIYWLNRGLQVDARGNLWVLPSRGVRDLPPGVVARYDVFDPDGRFDRQVEVACDGDSDEDGIFLLDDTRLLLVKGYVDATATLLGGAPDEDDGGEAAPMELVCYRIVE